MSKNRLQLFPRTTQIETTAAGEELTIAGCNLSDLAEHYGTPLYIYDVATLDAAVTEYQNSLANFYLGEAGITYAGKAFLCIALAGWIHRRHLWVDCTDLGELQVATAAGVPRENILLHGVNKSRWVLSTGITQAGTIVVDNITELGRLAELAQKAETPLPNLWLRFRPGEVVDTHAHIQTGQSDSKFGMDGHEIVGAAHFCRANHLPLNGLHFHLGSQFRDPGPLEYALAHTLDLAEELNLEAGWTFCPGGGWGVAYHEDELPFPSIQDYVRFVAEKVLDGCHNRGIPLPRLQLEPGRSLVARAGVAIYRVGTVKRTPERCWVLLDGGLADNPRFALYQARYTALPISYPLRPATGPAWLAGPYCESGDILIAGLPLPDLQPGELIAIPVSGAYHLSMANNYNGAMRPAVLWLEDGKASLIRGRETPEDLIRHDKPLPDTSMGLSSVTFHKYHGLGNDYILVREADLHRSLTPTQIRRICDRHYGFGADGILLDCSPAKGEFAARFFNPDGSEAEKSGNGLRIYARYLWDNGRVHLEPFKIGTAGGAVEAQVHQGGGRVRVMMGPASFDSREIPVQGPPREVIDETIRVGDQVFMYSAVTLGNPHCVVLRGEVSAEEIQYWGPYLENEPRFPNRTNVQFMKVLDPENIQIEIWERGVGYTLASGSSSCAAALVAHRLGLCEAEITVHMPGGEIEIAIDDDFNASMTGSVARVWQGNISEEAFGN
jgi:diaminopimelate decarboxylase/diaminopimelate epimerase